MLLMLQHKAGTIRQYSGLIANGTTSCARSDADIWPSQHGCRADCVYNHLHAQVRVPALLAYPRTTALSKHYMEHNSHAACTLRHAHARRRQNPMEHGMDVGMPVLGV